jgi:hypothetical protein
LASALSQTLGIDADAIDYATNPWVVLVIVPLFGVGPAAAYYLARWLRSRSVPMLVGCGALALWVIVLSIIGPLLGWLAVIGLSVVTALIMWRWRRPPRRVPTDRSELDATLRRPGYTDEPAEVDAPPAAAPGESGVASLEQQRLSNFLMGIGCLVLQVIALVVLVIVVLNWVL